MTFLSRDFTRTEAVLMAFLGILLVGIFYYQFVHVTVERNMAEAVAKRDALWEEQEKTRKHLEQLKKMKEEIEQPSAQASLMPSYSSYQAEITMLNDILQSASQYSINFANLASRTGDQVRRKFSLSFTVPNYAAAKDIIRNLTDSDIRCLLGNVTFNGPVGGAEEVKVKLEGTFYETMEGGKQDIFVTGSG